CDAERHAANGSRHETGMPSARQLQQKLGGITLNVDDMVCLKIDCHADTDLLGASRLVIENSNIESRIAFLDSNPHPLHMHLVVDGNTKHQLGKIARAQSLACHLHRNLESVWIVPIPL